MAEFEKQSESIEGEYPPSIKKSDSLQLEKGYNEDEEQQNKFKKEEENS